LNLLKEQGNQMIKAKINFKMKIPDLNFQKDLLYVAEKIAIPDMIGGIKKRMDVSGGSFPTLAPATIKRKGHDKPLIDTKQLIKSFIFKKRGKHKVLITLKRVRKEIGEFLQIAGIKSKQGTKHFEFFGISKRAERQAISHMRLKLRKIIRNA